MEQRKAINWEDYHKQLAKANDGEKAKIFFKLLNSEVLQSKNLAEQLKKNGETPGKQDDYDYIPVEVVEDGLRQIFLGQAQITIVNSEQVLNSYLVHVRLVYPYPGIPEPYSVDGIGAAPFEQKTNDAKKYLEQRLTAEAVAMAAPLAYSRALKNAAKKLGPLFGADLNRDTEITNRKSRPKQLTAEGKRILIEQYLQDEEQLVLRPEELEGIKRIYNDKIVKEYDKAIVALKKAKK